MTHIDHAAHALRAMNQAPSHYETDENTAAIVAMQAAQVRATLALAEQQRIANLIALTAMGNSVIVPPDVAAALGIETDHE